jgi:hypothetical protein
MSTEKPAQITEDELQAILKEDYIRSSGAMFIGETVADYRKRKEEEWDRMNPKKETTEATVTKTETVTNNEEGNKQWKKRVEESEAKRQVDLKRVRQELGLDASPEKPKRNYVEVVIDDDFMRKNLMPNGGLRMKKGEATWKGEVNLMKYVISENLSPEYRQIALDKIKKMEAGQEKTYAHESQHIQNRENGLTPHLSAKSLREYLAFRVLDEMSAFANGELDGQEMSAENILQALRAAEKDITDSYYGETFSGDADWYMSQHGKEPGALDRKIDQERYHKIVSQYFRIKGQNVISILQKNGRISEYAEITNRLIIKLDSLLETKKTTQGQEANSVMESTGNTEKVENKEKKGEEKLLEKFDELVAEKLEKFQRENPERRIAYVSIKKMLDDMRQRKSKAEITGWVIDVINHKKRNANYPPDQQYEGAWDVATNEGSLSNKIENNWVYRGNFSTSEKKTVTRGSLNVVVSEDFVREIDSLIRRGILDANYKFGEPGTMAQASDRHDAVTVYFLTEPTPEAMESLSRIADKYYRGDDLLGKKISKGFYMSEVGSVSDTHAKEFIQQIKTIDAELSGSVANFLTSRKNGKERVAMSEAQFYSIKETLDLFGIKVEYKPESGFVVVKV